MKGPLIVHRRVSQQVNPNDEWKLNVYIDNFDEYGILPELEKKDYEI